MWNRTNTTFGGKILAIAFVCLISVNAFSQNITNTIAPSGKFIVKDASNNYLTVSEPTGYLSLNKSLEIPNSTDATLGVIFKGADRFIHNYGTNNTFMGINSGNFTMTGSYNIAIGDQSLFLNTDGSWNTAIGQFSLFSNITGYYNTALGLYSLVSNTTGNNNTALGVQSLYYNTIGTKNTAVGVQALFSNTIGDRNTAVGYQSLFSNIGFPIGFQGIENTAVGIESLYSNTSGSWNTASGDKSLYSNTSGYGNTALGFHSLYQNSTGMYNTALGYGSGVIINGGINLTCLGSGAEPTSINATNQITLGDNNITSLRCYVTAITALSDARDKKNIKDLNLGIDFLMKIKPRLFNWDKREWYDGNKSDGSKMKEEPTAGFIAQELDEVQTTGKAEWLNLVLKDNPEKLEATPGNLLPIMVKAIQDLKKENDELQVANNGLRATTVELTGRLTKFEQIQNILVTEIEKLKTNNNESIKVSLGAK